MFDTLPISHLATMLTHFAFPMLVAERPDAKTEFRMVAMNAALEDIAGPQDTMGSRTLRDLFPPNVMDEVIQSFNANEDRQQTQQFRSVLCGMSGEVPCDLRLQYLRCPDGFDRVIATAQEARAFDLDLKDKIAFEDIRYFSFIADLQLENLNSAFLSATEQAHIAPIGEERIVRLHAVCRTIQRTVSDIKDVVKQAQARHAKQGSAHHTGARMPTDLPVIRNDTSLFAALADEQIVETQYTSP